MLKRFKLKHIILLIDLEEFFFKNLSKIYSKKKLLQYGARCVKRGFRFNLFFWCTKIEKEIKNKLTYA